MSSLFIRCVGVLMIASMLLFPTGALAAPDGSNETVHIVQWGETLSMIAEHYGVTVEAIMAANGITITRSSGEIRCQVLPGSMARPPMR
jgi:hypothetical protein